MITVRPDADARSFAQTITELGRHINTALLRSLIGGPRRFNEIAEQFPNVEGDEVSAALRELDADGLVARRVDSGPPLRVLYELTPHGNELTPALTALAEWAQAQP